MNNKLKVSFLSYQCYFNQFCFCMHSKQLLNYFAGCESFFCSVHVMTIPYTHRKHRSFLKLCSNTHPGPSQILVDFNMPSAWLRRSQIYFIITNQWKNPYLQHWQSVENILNTKFLRIKINLITSKSRGNTLLCREGGTWAVP